MKKAIYFPLFALLLFVINVKAQTITGKVVDEQKQPISYVNIQLGSTYSVLTNDEGDFVFQTPSQTTADKVILTCLGYETLQIPLANFKDGDYVLKEQVYILDEVAISNRKLTPLEIIKKVIENGPNNYNSETSKQTFFLRSSADSKMIDMEFEYLKSSLEKKSNLKELNNDIEAFTKKLKGSRSKDFAEYYGLLYQQSKESKLLVEKAISLKNKDKNISEDDIVNKLMKVINLHLEPNATYRIKSGFFPLEDSLKVDMPLKDIETHPKTAFLKEQIMSLSNSLNKFYTNDKLDFLTEYKRYDYNIVGYSNFNDDPICIISFKPQKSSAKYTGKIYVNTDNFAVVKLEYNLVEGATEHNINLKFLLGIKAVQDGTKVIATFNKNDEGKYAVDFLKKAGRTYFYINRSLKITKNKVDKKEETQMLKFDFLLEIDTYIVQELYIINKESIKNDEFKNIKEVERFEVKPLTKYDPSIWKNYNVLAPIEAIKNYN